jgi:PAS domain-containing protein
MKLIGNSLKILWAVPALCFLALCAAMLKSGAATDYYWTAAALLAALSWLYITARLFFFRRKLVNFCRRLLAGDYETGIKARKGFADEITSVANLMNAAVERLRVYDELRASRVSLGYRALEYLHNNVSDAIMIADAEKEVFRLNAAAMSFFGVDQDRISFDSVENKPGNEEFRALFARAVKKEKIAVEGEVEINLPARDASRRAFVKIQPLKDSQEDVKLAIILMAPAA